MVYARARPDGDFGAFGEVCGDLTVASEKRCGFDGERDKERRSCLIVAKLSAGPCVGDSRCGTLGLECRGEYSNSIIAGSFVGSWQCGMRAMFVDCAVVAL